VIRPLLLLALPWLESRHASASIPSLPASFDLLAHPANVRRCHSDQHLSFDETERTDTEAGDEANYKTHLIDVDTDDGDGDGEIDNQARVNVVAWNLATRTRLPGGRGASFE
jgi:hypothetical protein